MASLSTLVPLNIDNVSWQDVAAIQLPKDEELKEVVRRSFEQRRDFSASFEPSDIDPAAIISSLPRKQQEDGRLTNRIALLIHTDLKLAALTAQCIEFSFKFLITRVSTFEGFPEDEVQKVLDFSENTRVGYIATPGQSEYYSAEELGFFLRFTSIDDKGFLKPVHHERYTEADIADLEKYMKSEDETASEMAAQTYREIFALRARELHKKVEAVWKETHKLIETLGSLLPKSIKQQSLIPYSSTLREERNELDLVSTRISLGKVNKVLDNYYQLNFWFFLNQREKLIKAQQSGYFARQEKLFTLFYNQLSPVQKKPYQHLVTPPSLEEDFDKLTLSKAKKRKKKKSAGTDVGGSSSNTNSVTTTPPPSTELKTKIDNACKQTSKGKYAQRVTRWFKLETNNLSEMKAFTDNGALTYKDRPDKDLPYIHAIHAFPTQIELLYQDRELREKYFIKIDHDFLVFGEVILKDGTKKVGMFKFGLDSNEIYHRCFECLEPKNFQQKHYRALIELDKAVKDIKKSGDLFYQELEPNQSYSHDTLITANDTTGAILFQQNGSGDSFKIIPNPFRTPTVTSSGK